MTTITILLTASALAGLSPSAPAQLPSSRYQIYPEIEQGIVKTRGADPNAGLVHTLSALQGSEEQATQVLLASIRLSDIEERNDIWSMIFMLPIGENGINATHIPLLVELYLKSAESPLSSKPRPRSFLNDSVFKSRLLGVLASLLDVESLTSTIPPGEPLPRLLYLLEAARDSATLSATVKATLDESFRLVSKRIEVSQPAVIKRKVPPTHNSPQPSSTTNEPSSTAWWPIIILPALAAIWLLWLFRKRLS